HVRGRVTGRLVDVPDAEVGLDLDAVDQLAVRRDQLRYSGVLAAPRLAVALERRLGDAALAPHLYPPRERALRILHRARHVLVVRVHPQLAAGRLHDRGGLPVVVAVRVRADEQANVLEPQAD